MQFDKLQLAANAYFAWLSEIQYYTPPQFSDYRPGVALSDEFVGYASVPVKLFTRDEFDELMKLIISTNIGSQEEHYAQYLYNVLLSRFNKVPNDGFHDGIEIVSLGGNCVPRLIFSKWGFRRTRPFGVRSLPFDLAWCEPSSISKIISNDFSNLVQPNLLEVTTKENARLEWHQFIGELPVVSNDRNSFLFNHEYGEQWSADNFRMLISRYNDRIKRFKDILSNPKPTIGLLAYQRSLTKSGFDDVLRCAEKIGSRSGGRVHILCVATSDIFSGFDCGHALRLCEKVSVTLRHNPQPAESYVFYAPSSYASRDGLAWELGFVRSLEQIIEAELN